MKEIEKLKETILKEYPRLSGDSTFSFRCHKDVPCFNDCCGDVNIFLTPYDVIRLRKKLGITSGEFLRKYTISPFDDNLKYPVVLLQMQDNEKKTCPFVGKNGCGVYADRPWACRMYPLGLASPGENSAELDKEFFFLIKEYFCKGFGENKNWTVNEWMTDQGIEEYNKMGEHFKELTLHKYFRDGHNLPPKKIEMFFMASYDIDRFREFIFESSFFEKFDVDDATKEKIKTDDTELMKFAHKWLLFALFNKKTIAVRDNVLQAKQKELTDKDELKKK
jgi:Fe-S-cluster containining protein